MEEKEVCYHVPVMLHESLEGLDIQPSGVYVDVTFGGGGHSREILNRLNDEGELYGFDQDADAEKNIPADSRFVFVRSNFRYLYNFMRYHGVAGEGCWPTWAFLPIILMTRIAGSLSVSTERWI